jgi:hypothetical protein
MVAPRKERPVRQRPEDPTRTARPRFRDANQLGRVGPRQGLQQHAVRHAEQHRCRPDAECHRENRDGSEARLTTEQSKAVEQVLQWRNYISRTETQKHRGATGTGNATRRAGCGPSAC